MKPNKRLRILHGPHNIGGLGGYCSDYQRGKGYDSSFVTWQDQTYRKNSVDTDFRVSTMRIMLKSWGI